MFSFWTFGPSQSSDNKSKVILSIKHTWINFGLSLIVTLSMLATFAILKINISTIIYIYLIISIPLSMFMCFTPMPNFLKSYSCKKIINVLRLVEIKLTAFDPSQPDLLIYYPEETNDIKMNAIE